MIEENIKCVYMEYSTQCSFMMFALESRSDRVLVNIIETEAPNYRWTYILTRSLFSLLPKEN